MQVMVMLEYLVTQNGRFKPIASVDRAVPASNTPDRGLTRCELRRALMDGRRVKNSKWKSGCFIRIYGEQMVNERGRPESPLILLIDGEWTVC